MTLSQLKIAAQAKANSGKSINKEAAVKVLNESGLFTSTLSKRSGYKDTKKAGNRFATSRKTVEYFTLTVEQNGKVLFSTDSELTNMSAYSFTSFIAFNL
jgi:hypothetical protein